ncbi:hypothetical protein EVAR_6990_1 [Eumeta japonica]|uniref:Uncharacterized protein n=1 Tax=Eumeta variegata TaxID=151549 RepID=A0A4C1TGM5_EUMVA|nr:hypothetical protein EVAR_6990_1 [Eumeta japonica]
MHCRLFWTGDCPWATTERFELQGPNARRTQVGMAIAFFCHYQRIFKKMQTVTSTGVSGVLNYQRIRSQPPHVTCHHALGNTLKIDRSPSISSYRPSPIDVATHKPHVPRRALKASLAAVVTATVIETDNAS